jgi:hypothetical protein
MGRGRARVEKEPYGDGGDMDGEVSKSTVRE